MQSYLKIPLYFFFVAGCIGLLLRWHLVSPVPGLIYPYWLHAHSHIMFLGWVFNVLYLAYVLEFIPLEKHKRYKVLFIVMQVLLLGMLVSFPIQGYGTVSITISTLHTVSVGIFCAWFFQDTRDKNNIISLKYARMSLIFFLISAVGPFSLGPLMANGLGQSPWYYVAIYFYLHFQYNGVFVFGVLGLFYNVIEYKGIDVSQPSAKYACYLLFGGTLLSYALSVLWAQPHYVFNFAGLTGALVQMAALSFFIKSIHWHSLADKNRLHLQTRWLFALAGVALCIKTILQLISAHPDIARLAYEVRPFVIGYLHLVVIGVVTFFLMGWYLEKKVVRTSSFIIILFITGFLGSELIMIFSSTPVHIKSHTAAIFGFIFSIFMIVSIMGLLTATQRK
jgi:hypothetical protein